MFNGVRVGQAALVRRGAIALVAVWVVVAGCGRTKQPDSAATGSQLPAAETTLTADEVLERMAETYRDAPSYSDDGRVRLRYRERGNFAGDEAPLKVISEYPDKLRVEAYRAAAVCDGEMLYATIGDELSEEIERQVLARPLSGELTLEQVYHDPVLREALTSGLGRQPIQLDLLFEDDPLLSILADDVPRELLEPASFEDHLCYRVQAKTADGVYVFWVDQEEFLLRKMEYPAATILPELAESDDVKDLELVAEFRAAKIKPKATEEAYRFDVPADATKVRAFVLPPSPLPTQLFGKRPGEFQFYQTAGGKLTSTELSDAISVLLWFNVHPACRTTLEQLSSLYATHEAADGVNFVAIATDPSEVSNRQIETILKDWQVDLPFVRDLDAHGRDVFGIPLAPTLVVLGRDGTVQIFEVGANPELEKALATIIDRLQKDADLASEIIAQHEREQDQYRQLLELAAGEGDTAVIDLALANIRPRSEPTQIKLEPAWSTSDVVEPGNLLALTGDVGSSLLVLESGRAVVELDVAGETVARHELPIEDDRVSLLRTHLDGEGKRHFLASAIQGRYAYWFDEQWKRLLRYPAAEQKHPGIFDCTLGDLDENGELELLLGFAGEVGVQSVRLDGSRRWSNRSMPNVLSVVAGQGEENRGRLLVSGETGDILRIRSDGKQESTQRLGGSKIFHLFAASWATDSPTQYCGLTYSEAGNLIAVGLSTNLEEVWSYPLPAGSFRNPIQFVTGGMIGELEFWCIAAADGSIHFIRADGGFSDNFAYGRELTGISLVNRILAVSIQDAVEAWSIALPDPQPN